MSFLGVLFGFLLLFISSLLDNGRPPAIPKLIETFHFSYEASGWFFSVGYLFAIFSAFALIRITERYSLERISRVLLFSAFGLGVGSFFVRDLRGLLLFSAVLGPTVSGLGSLCNLFVIRASRPDLQTRLLCGLHCVYGVSSFFAPICVEALYRQGYGWNVPFFAFGTAALLLVFFPVHAPAKKNENSPTKLIMGRQEWAAVVTMATYVTGEVLVSSWMPTYLVSKGVSTGQASYLLSSFFIMMALSRALCFVGLRERTERLVIAGCLLFSILFFILGLCGWYWAFALVGIFGPFFPGFLSILNTRFRNHQTPLTLFIFAMDQTTLALSQWLFGTTADRLGMATAYGIPPIFLMLALLTFLRVFWRR